jgi:hypothetical protein
MIHTLPRKKCYLWYIIIQKLAEKGSIYLNGVVREKPKSPNNKQTSQDAIAFTQTFDCLMMHMPNFMVIPNGKINISLKSRSNLSKNM